MSNELEKAAADASAATGMSERRAAKLANLHLNEIDDPVWPDVKGENAPMAPEVLDTNILKRAARDASETLGLDVRVRFGTLVSRKGVLSVVYVEAWETPLSCYATGDVPMIYSNDMEPHAALKYVKGLRHGAYLERSRHNDKGTDSGR